MADDIWTLARSVRVRSARDAAHFELLRAADAVRRPAVRRVAGTIVVSIALVATVVVTGAGADERRAAAPAPQGIQASGSAAAQTFEGSRRADRLDGGAGNDVLLGKAGDDSLRGGTGADVLEGGSGDDHLDAGPGRDVLLGGAGDDTLRAGDVDGLPDRLHCGSGNDTAWIVSVNGRTTDRTFDCEHVNIVTVRTLRRR